METTNYLLRLLSTYPSYLATVGIVQDCYVFLPWKRKIYSFSRYHIIYIA